MENKKKTKSVKPATIENKETASSNVPQPLKNAVVASTRLTDFDIHLFRSGKHYRLYEKFGSHVMEIDGTTGTYFAVWAPNATYISVIGNFNGWNNQAHSLFVRWDSSGIWEGFIPNVGNGEVYKYFIKA